MHNIAYIEAALDDPEHISLDEYSEELKKTVDKIKGELKELIDNSDNRRVVYEGIKTVILGKPNAGKSSFLNSLVGEERAIVTDIEGTTRDILEEHVIIHGISLNIIDTAGIRETEDKVEQIGVERAKKCADTADLIIYIVDSSRKLDESDKEILELIKEKKVIILYNKCDLVPAIQPQELKKITNAPVIKISAKQGDGMDLFEKTLKDMFFAGNLNINDEVFITNARQKNDIRKAYESIEMVEEGIRGGMSEDFFTIDLMNAYEALGRVIGEAVEDDLVNTIFQKFCMGK